MTIIYALVARKSTVLAEYTSSTGNFTTVTQAILEKIPSHDSKMSYVYDRYLFHYISEGGLIYLCMAEEAFGRQLPFGFLADIKEKFLQMYDSRGRTAVAYGMNDDFSRVLAKQMDYYSNNASADKVTKIKGDIDGVKQVMVQNIEKVLENTAQIGVLVDKAENLNNRALDFKKKSTQLKRAMWWKNTRLMIALVIVIIIVLYFIISFACGGLDWHKCVHKKKKKDHHDDPDKSPSPASPEATALQWMLST